ncbi:MAG: porin family protein [Bacteroidota bacterium]
MKKTIILSAMIAVAMSSNQADAQIYRMKAGLNLSNMVMKDNNETYSSDFENTPGIHLGGSIQIPSEGIFSFEGGMQFSTKGFYYSESGQFDGYDLEVEQTTSLFYLEMPLTARSTFDLGWGKIYANLGPYIGIGLTGKYKYRFELFGETEEDEEDIDWGSGKEDDLRRFDAGLFAGAGMEFKRVQIGMTYGLGLVNISSVQENGMTVQNKTIGISVGYRLVE